MFDVFLCFLSYYSDGTFCLWETNTWTSEPWSLSTGSGSVTVNSIVAQYIGLLIDKHYC